MRREVWSVEEEGSLTPSCGAGGLWEGSKRPYGDLFLRKLEGRRVDAERGCRAQPAMTQGCPGCEATVRRASEVNVSYGAARKQGKKRPLK